MDVLDFETRSRADLRALGSFVYAKDPSTSILCMSYKLGEEKTELWIPGQPFPSDLATAIASGRVMHAWNAAFEIDLWNEVAAPRMGWPLMPLGQWHCLMCDAGAMGFPLGLDNCAEAMGLPIQKDQEGRRAMLQLCKPNRDSMFIERDDRPDLFTALYRYCVNDTDLEVECGIRLPRIC